MKIDLGQMSLEGTEYTETLDSRLLDIDADMVAFQSPVKARAYVTRITNAITVHLSLEGTMLVRCSRCLHESLVALDKELDLNYSVTPEDAAIDLDPDIREEILLGFAIQPLCKPDCRGLCPKCGKDLNDGKCSCSK